MLDLGQVRQDLNEQEFKEGRRSILLGRASEMFAEANDEELAARVQSLCQELQRHDLLLVNGERDPDSLYVVQQLRSSAVDLSWMAEGMAWVAKITTVAAEMVLPGVAGIWLDRQFGTNLLAPIGFAIGVPVGLWHLIQLTRRGRVAGDARLHDGRES